MQYSSRIKRMDVMLIDPDKVSRGNLGALLRDFGCYSVRPFEDCETPIVSIISKPPSVVFCNWDPDQRFAEQVLRSVRCQNSDKIAATAVILVSRNLNRKMMSEGLRAGATQFISSPVVPADLLKKLEFVLNDQRPMVRKNGRLQYAAAPRKLVKKQRPSVKVMEFTAKSSAPSEPVLAKPVKSDKSALNPPITESVALKQVPEDPDSEQALDDVLEL